MFTLYNTLAYAPFVVFPSTADALLARVDRILFASPALALAAALPEWLREFLFAVYALFIPYLLVSIALQLCCASNRQRDVFIAGFALTYAAAFLGYLFLPARGPVVFHAGVFTAANPGFFQQLVADSLASCGGPHGAFPSLHTAAALYVLLADLRRDPLRAWACVPLVSLIALATVGTGYHYAVDTLAGAAIAFGAYAAAPAVAGLPAFAARSAIRRAL